MVFKRYFVQRFLDGLQRKVKAYPCKIGLIPRWKTSTLFNFLKNAAISVYLVNKPVSAAGISQHNAQG